MRKEKHSRTGKDSDPSAKTLWNNPKGCELQAAQMLVEANKAYGRQSKYGCTHSQL